MLASVWGQDEHTVCIYRLMDKVKHHLVQVAEASKQLPSSQPPAITAALLETYSRLLIWLGTRNFQSMYKVITECPTVHPSLLLSSTDPCSVQEPGMGCATCTARSYCISRPSTATIFIPLPAPTAVAHCSGRGHYSLTALCLVSSSHFLITWYLHLPTVQRIQHYVSSRASAVLSFSCSWPKSIPQILSLSAMYDMYWWSFSSHLLCSCSFCLRRARNLIECLCVC